MTSVHEPASLEAHYTQYYRAEKDADSPVASRTRMVRAMTSFILAGNGSMRVLDIGAGRRELEGALRRNAKGNTDGQLADKLHQTSLISFDIADIPSRRLIPSGGLHVRADSRAMPFASNTFDLTVSNLSIDMLRHQPGEFEVAMAEASRVTKLGGVVLLNYHPAELFSELSNCYDGHGGILESFFNGNESLNPFYDNQADIAADLLEVGIAPIHIDKMTEVPLPGEQYANSWWEVVGQRVN